MFQRYKMDRTEDAPEYARGLVHAHGDDPSDALPFDLALSRRVNGTPMALKWGMRDPADAPAAAPLADPAAQPDPQVTALEGTVLPRAYLRRQHLPAAPLHDMWGDLRAVPFGYGAASPLDMQSLLTGGDRAMVRAFDDLRTQLLRTIQGEGWSRIAVAAPTSGCGASFTAVNLALSVARIPDARTLLMDMDQRAPSVARMLGIPAPCDMQRLLSGRVEPEVHLLRASQTLAVGLGRPGAQNPSEILHARRTGAVLRQLVDDLRPDITIYDMPAMLEHDDLEAFLPHVDGVLLMADATRTLAHQITECERRLEGKTNLLGIILNRTRPAARRAA